jgi:ribosome modulation factor
MTNKKRYQAAQATFKIHQEGFGAYASGLDVGSNPYQLGTPQRQAWHEGWQNACTLQPRV